MHFVALYVDGTERLCRTEVLACSATDASAHIYGRELESVLIAFVDRHHDDGSRRTVAGTVAAFHSIRKDDAVLLRPDGMANLNSRFVFLFDRLDGTGRTNLAASVALWSAISTLIRQGRLHQMHQVCRWTEHIVRAFCHAELAGSAMLRHILCRDRTWRCDRCMTLERFLLGYGSQSAIYLFLLLCQGSSRSNSCSSQQEVSARGVRSIVLYSLSFVFHILFTLHPLYTLSGSIVKRLLVAMSDAVAANHASGVIYLVVLAVDASRLAALGAQSATDAFVLIYSHLQP